MRQSESIKNFADAMSKAQGTMRNAARDSVNPHFKSRYADLASVIDAIREPATSNGLSWSQGLGGDGKILVCTTRIMHSSGEWIESDLTIIPTKPDSQGIGSASTYAKRYSLSSMFGISSEDDDDGNGASRTASAPQREVPAAPTLPQSNAKQSFAAAVTEWTGMTGNDMGQAAKEIAAVSGINLASATDSMYSALLTYTANQIEQGVKFTEWSAANKKPAASAVKVKG